MRKGLRGGSSRGYSRVAASTSARMKAVRRTNTHPEAEVQRLLRDLAVSYSVGGSELPGSPDIVMLAARKAIFVHGCFWHGHSGCRRSKLPRNNASTWKNKVLENQKRDRRVLRQLRDRGWKTLVIWECQVRDEERCGAKVASFLRR
jgi:DNA mismatch endonuclease (patch repair protein)